MRNVFDVEDDVYETPILAYNRELDFLVLTSCIIKNDAEEKNSPPYPEDAVTYSKEETMNSEDTIWQLHHSSQWVPMN